MLEDFFKSSNNNKNSSNLEFRVSTQPEMERLAKYFKNRDFVPMPKDLLVTSNSPS